MFAQLDARGDRAIWSDAAGSWNPGCGINDRGGMNGGTGGYFGLFNWRHGHAGSVPALLRVAAAPGVGRSTRTQVTVASQASFSPT